MSYSIEKVGGPHLLGEGPHWDEGRQVLYYVDAPGSSICRYSPQEQKVYQCKLGEYFYMFGMTQKIT